MKMHQLYISVKDRLINSTFWFFQTGHLAMETLLSLTSKRAGDWFKEELRLLGGLDHIVDKGIVNIFQIHRKNINRIHGRRISMIKLLDFLIF